MSKTILIVDDEKDIRTLLKRYFELNGYLVATAENGLQAIEKAGLQPDLILLDLMLPGLSGEELLPQIKDIPVIVISAKADTADKVGLLLGGAADYITKPFDMDELLARITVQLRGKSYSTEKKSIEYQEIKLYTDSHTVTIYDKEVRLTRTEYAILKLLMQNPEKVVAKLTILDKISYDTPDCTEDSLKIHIHNLRKKLKAASGKEYISAVWGIGFMLKS